MFNMDLFDLSDSDFLTQNYLKHHFHYDDLTGDFVRSRGFYVGSFGHFNSKGYKIMKIKGKNYFIHRLIWLYVYGCFPICVIDHIDGNPSNNRLSNLRDVSMSGNAQNKIKHRSDSKTGFMGVSFRRRFYSSDRFLDIYTARIQVGSKRVFLGQFKTAEQASAAYISAKRLYHLTCTI